MAYEGKTKEALKIDNDSMTPEEFREFLEKAFKCASDHMEDGASFYVWHSSSEHINFESALRAVGLDVRQQLIWNKSSMVLGRSDYHWKHEPCMYGWKKPGAHRWHGDRKQTTVMDFDRPNRNAEHPTMKPVELMAYQIRNSSCKGETVLDLFGGSGSTLIACEETGRRCRMMEYDPRYVDVIISRWESISGKKAVRA